MSDYNDGSGLAAILGLLAVFFVILLPLLIAFYVLGSWFLMKIFQKAGVQGGWRAWVPVYNLMIFSKLGDLSPWLILYAIGGSIVLGLIPGVGGFLGWILNLAAAAISLLAAWRVGSEAAEVARLGRPVLLPRPSSGSASTPSIARAGTRPCRPRRGPATASWATAPTGPASRASCRPPATRPRRPLRPTRRPPATTRRPPGTSPPPAGYEAPPAGYQAAAAAAGRLHAAARGTGARAAGSARAAGPRAAGSARRRTGA